MPARTCVGRVRFRTPRVCVRQVFFFGSGAAEHARGGISVLDAQRAIAACAGKNDFILFEPLEDAVRMNKRVVVTAPLGGSQALRSSQAYFAESLAKWLSEEKVDGAGRAYGETRDEDPTLRKKLSRAQIQAILRFGGMANAAK